MMARRKPSPRPIGLVAFCRQIQVELSRLAGRTLTSQDRTSVDSVAFKALSEQIVAGVEGAEVHRSRKAFSLPTERAYQWLKHLSNRENLVTHLRTLAAMVEISRSEAYRSNIPAPFDRLPVEIELFNQPTLFRMRAGRDAIRIVVHEGYAGAPRPVLQSLVCAALPQHRQVHQKRAKTDLAFRAYAESPAFLQVLQSIQRTSLPEEQTAGRVYDLEEVFERVSREYFSGQMPRPRLAWSQRRTRRKFGHYQANLDTVVISRSMDEATIPEYVIDMIMYHELLHKALGCEELNGRRYSHTARFRQEERRFARYPEAQDFLNHLSQAAPVKRRKTQVYRRKRRK